MHLRTISFFVWLFLWSNVFLLGSYDISQIDPLLRSNAITFRLIKKENFCEVQGIQEKIAAGAATEAEEICYAILMSVLGEVAGTWAARPEETNIAASGGEERNQEARLYQQSEMGALSNVNLHISLLHTEETRMHEEIVFSHNTDRSDPHESFGLKEACALLDVAHNIDTMNLSGKTRALSDCRIVDVQQRSDQESKTNKRVSFVEKTLVHVPSDGPHFKPSHTVYDTHDENTVKIGESNEVKNHYTSVFSGKIKITKLPQEVHPTGKELKEIAKNKEVAEVSSLASLEKNQKYLTRLHYAEKRCLQYLEECEMEWKEAAEKMNSIKTDKARSIDQRAAALGLLFEDKYREIKRLLLGKYPDHKKDNLFFFLKKYPELQTPLLIEHLAFWGQRVINAASKTEAIKHFKKTEAPIQFYPPAWTLHQQLGEAIRFLKFSDTEIVKQEAQTACDKKEETTFSLSPEEKRKEVIQHVLGMIEKLDETAEQLREKLRTYNTEKEKN